jgi:hypothetical protein
MMMRYLAMLIVLLVLLTACQGLAPPGREQARPAQSAGPAQPIPVIELPSQGRTIKIEEIGVSDRVPPGCNSPGTSDCAATPPASQALVVYLSDPGPYTIQELYQRCLVEAEDRIRVVDETGRQTPCLTAGEIGGRWMLVFTPSASAKRLTLYFPGAAPVALPAL